MSDWIWFGVGAVAVLAGVALAALVHAADRRARQETMRRLTAQAKIPVQLVREPTPLEQPKVLGRIGPAGRA